MKKRLFTSVLSVLLLVVMSIFGLAACGTTEEKKITLSESVKELTVGESFTLTATTTPADAEVVWSSSDEAIVTVVDGTVKAESVGTATVTAKNDTATATCQITVKAAPVQTYTVIFKNGETTWKEIEVNAGATASYTGAAPSKAATAEYEYTFAGWALTEGGEAVDLSSVQINEATTFHALFVASTRQYTVSWVVNGDSTEETIVYGEVPQYKGTTPTKATVGDVRYTFVGWAASLSGDALDVLPAVSSDVAYYAVFAEVTAEMRFTITWKNGEETLKTDGELAFETPAVYTGETPAKASTEAITYVFVGWAAYVGGDVLETLPNVTADVTYFAVFEETAREYTITWVIEGVENTTECAYGSVPEYTETPTKEDSATCSYQFVGWALTEDGEAEEALPAVSGEARYYAVFEVGEVFEFPKYMAGKIDYSAKSEEVFLPEGLLGEGVSIVEATLRVEGSDNVVAYTEGAWVHSVLALTEEEWKTNAIGVRTLEMSFSDGSKYLVNMNVYAGIINELSDFPVFFNNTAVANEADNAADYPMVAPDTYGYYIVTQDLGSYTFDKAKNTFVYEDELALTQTGLTNYGKTNGFNGVLDGQGHTLKFKLTSGGLVGLVLGNATIKNLAVIYEDASFISQAEGGGYGAFGYITNGAPEIRNCYIERTNNVASRSTVLGLMARPNGKLILHETVVYGFLVPNDCTWWSTEVNCISAASTNAYVIHARANATSQSMVRNFTKVFNDSVENGSREVLLSEVEDASKFDSKYWYKENGKLIWKGFELATVTWVKGEETITETVSKDGWIMYTQTLPENVTTNTETVTYYWSTTEDGAAVKFSDRFQVVENVTYYMVENRQERVYTVTWSIDGETTTTDYKYGEQAAHEDPKKAEDDYYTYEFKGWSLTDGGEVVELGAVTDNGTTYYAVFEATAKVILTTVNEALLYSSADDQLFLPTELTLEMDDTVKISSKDGATIYYENGAWVNNFDLTAEQLNANAIASFEIMIEKGTNLYAATVKSYAGVIDELSDFPAFFNNEAVENTNPNNAADYPMVAPSVYGYYVVAKDLGTGAEELSFTQCAVSNFTATCGFNGVLDGQGHTVKFKLMSGGLLGLILGNATIKNLSVIYADETSTQYGVFGYMTNGNPVIENCYIERTNNKYQKWSVFGIMSRPNAKLILKNTVVYGYNISNNCEMNSNMWISASSTNAYLIHAREEATGWVNVKNFTKVFNDGVENGAREVALSEIADASGFNACWSKENEKLTWKGAADTAFSSVVKVNVAE